MAYRNKRAEIAKMALDYKIGEKIPEWKYDDEDRKTWAFCYENLMELQTKNASTEFNEVIKQF